MTNSPRSKQSLTHPLLRRDVLRAMGVVTAALVTGCAHLRQEPALDAALAALREELADSDRDDVAMLCDQIGSTARAMLDTHDRFLRRFNAQASDASTDASTLLRLTGNYQTGITAQRNQLLSLQDKLHDAIPAEQWPAVRKHLLATGQQFMDDTARDGP